MDRKSTKLLHFLPLTPLRSHVSHTHAQTDAHSSRAGRRNPNVLISRDKQRQGEHWAALTHRETSPISGLIKELLRPTYGLSNVPPPSSLPGLPPHLQWERLSSLLCETESIQSILKLLWGSLLSRSYHHNLNQSCLPLTCLKFNWILAWSCFVFSLASVK